MFLKSSARGDLWILFSPRVYFFFGSVILDVIQCVYIAKWVTGVGSGVERESEKRVGIGAPVDDVVVALATEWLSTRRPKRLSWRG